jgi:hypothetical protein
MFSIWRRFVTETFVLETLCYRRRSVTKTFCYGDVLYGDVCRGDVLCDDVLYMRRSSTIKKIGLGCRVGRLKRIEETRVVLGIERNTSTKI